MPPDRPTGADLTAEVMQAILIGAALAIPVSLAATEHPWLTAGWLAAGWLLFWLVRTAVRRIWQFLAAAAAIIAAPIVLPDWLGFSLPLLNVILLVAVLVLLGIRAFVQRLMSAGEKAPRSLLNHVLALAFLFGIDMLADYLELESLVAACFYLAIAYLLLAVIRWHATALDGYLSRFAKMPTQPAIQIMRHNRLLLIGFTVFLLLLLLVSPWLRLHELVPLLGRQLLLVLRWVIALILSLFRAPTANPEPQETSMPASTDPQLPETGETAAWMKILSEIMYVLLLAVGILLILGLVIYGLVLLYRRFYAARQSGPDTRESLLPDVVDQFRERIQRSAVRMRQRFGMDPDQRIRRLFVRFAENRAHAGKVSLGGLTARQIADLAGRQNPGVTRDITTLYEKARYGNHLCTGDDVRQMQQLCRGREEHQA